MRPPGSVVPPDCPFHSILFDSDLLGSGAQGAWDSLVGALRRRHVVGKAWRRRAPLTVNMSARKERNVWLGLGAQHVRAGNTHWPPRLRPDQLVRRKSWSCEVATRVRTLCPALYDRYHPKHCGEPHVDNSSAASVYRLAPVGRNATPFACS